MYHVKLYRMVTDTEGMVFYQHRFNTYDEAVDFVLDSPIYDAYTITFEGNHNHV